MAEGPPSSGTPVLPSVTLTDLDQTLNSFSFSLCRLTRTLAPFSPLCCQGPLLSWRRPAEFSWKVSSSRWPWATPGRRTSPSSAEGKGQRRWFVLSSACGVGPPSSSVPLCVQVPGGLVPHPGHAAVQTGAHLHLGRGGRRPGPLAHAEHRTDAARPFQTLPGTRRFPQ